MAQPNIQILISVAQQSRAQLQGAATDIKGIIDALGSIDGSSTNAAADAAKKFADAQSSAAQASRQAAAAQHGQAEETKSLNEALRTVGEAAKFAAGGFLALEAVRFFKDLADNAARAQVLQTVLRQVGGNAGYTQEQLDTVDKSVQRLGITAQASRQSLSNLIAANIDLSHATTLARAAQDLAVISGENSSQTFQRLIHAVEIRSTLDLRTLGINISLKEAEDKYARSLGETADQLTVRQQQQALVAAVEEAAIRRQGTYTAALADVGKQITSLDRITQNLSTSLGQNLLPTYLVLVQQLSIFLEELTDTSNAQNAASDGGQRLAAAVQAIVVPVRELLTFLADHYKVVGAVGLAFLAAAGYITTASLAETVLGAALISNTVALGEQAVAVAGLGGGLEALVAVLGVTSLAIGGIVAAVVAATASLGFFLKAEKDAVPGAKWVDVLRSGLLGLKEDLKDVGVALGVINGQLTFTSGKDLTKQALQNREVVQGDPERALQALKDAREGNLDATRKLIAAGKTGVQADIKAAEEASKLASKRLTDAQKSFDKALTTNGGDPARRKFLQDKADQQKKELEQQQRSEDAQEGLAKILGGDSVADDGGLKSKKLNEDIGSFNSAFNDFTQSTDKSKTSANQLSAALRKLSESVKTPDDLKAYTDQVARLQKVSQGVSPDGKLVVTPDLQAQARQALSGSNLDSALARQRVTQDARARTAPLDAIAREQATNRNTAIQQRVELEAATLKNANAEKDKAAKADYDNGILSLDQYFAGRMDRINQNAAAELKVEQTRIQGLERLRGLRGQTPEQRRGVTNQIEKIQDDEKTQAQQQQNSLADVATEKQNEQLAIQRRILEVQDGTEKLQGGLSGTLDNINRKYDELLRTSRGIGTAQIEAGREAEQFKANLDEQNRSVQAQIQLNTANREARKVKLETAAQNGDITPEQLENAQNDIVRDQQSDIAAQVKELKDRITQFQAEISNAQTRQPGAKVSQYEQNISALKEQITSLNTQSEQLGNTIVDYGNKIRDEFAGSISNALSGLATDFKHAQSILIDLGKSIEKSILDPITKNLAAKFVDSIQNATSDVEKNADGSVKKDENGNPIRKQGTGVFSGLGKLIGGNQKVPVGSKNNPSYTYIVGSSNTLALPNAQGSSSTRATTTSADGSQVSLPGGGDTPAGLDSSPLNSTVQDGAKIAASTATQVTDGVRQAASGNVGGALQSFTPLLKKGISALSGLFGGGSSAGVTQAFAAADGPSAADAISGDAEGGGGFTGAGLDDFGFAGGGRVSGKGTGTSDSIPAKLSDGEYVVRAMQTARWLPLLHAINEGHLDRVQSIAMPRGLAIPHFSQGGLVGGGGGGSYGGPGGIHLQIHPDMAQRTLGDWFTSELARQSANR